MQEGAILPEIICRLSTVYGSGRVDIVALTLFLQDLNSDKAVPESYAELIDCSDMNMVTEDDNKHQTMDDILSEDCQAMDGEEEEEEEEDEEGKGSPATHISSSGDSRKKVFKSRTKVACTFCGKVTVNKYTLDAHITTTHPAARQSCSQCGKVYGLAELLAKHVRLKHDKTPRVKIENNADGDEASRLGWKCPDCDKVFKSRKSQELHFFHHLSGGKKLFECGICGKRLQNPATLNKHIETLHKESAEQLQCGQCDAGFSVRSEWTEHLRSPCPVCRSCQAVFPTLAELKLHAVSCKNGPTAAATRAVRCEYCGKTYSSEGAVKHHIKRVHLKEMDFMCNMCERKFSSKADLLKHIAAMHDAERQTFVCDACGKAYFSVFKLQNHISYAHLNKEKPFACDICPSRFLYHPEMLRHRERHAVAPQHPCPFCDKKFGTNTDMSRHKKVVHENYHVGSCEICGR